MAAGNLRSATVNSRHSTIVIKCKDLGLSNNGVHLGGNTSLPRCAKKCFQSSLWLRTRAISLTIKLHEAQRTVDNWQVSACTSSTLAQSQEPPYPQCIAAGSCLQPVPIPDADWTKDEHL